MLPYTGLGICDAYYVHLKKLQQSTSISALLGVLHYVHKRKQGDIGRGTLLEETRRTYRRSISFEMNNSIETDLI